MHKIIIANLISYVIWFVVIMASLVGIGLLSDKESK